MDPFTLLGIAQTADDEQVKAAYFAKIKQFSPEHHPAQFKQIQTAYQQLKNSTGRIKMSLLQPPQWDLPLLLGGLVIENRQRPNTGQLLNLLGKCSNYDNK